VTAIKDTFLKISFPQLVNLTIVAERSPRPWRAHTGTIREFDALMRQLGSVAGTLIELAINIGPAFDKIFLNYLKPVTSKFTAFSKLRKLSLLWQALAAPEYQTGSYSLATAVPSFAKVNIGTLLPASLETLPLRYRIGVLTLERDFLQCFKPRAVFFSR